MTDVPVTSLLGCLIETLFVVMMMVVMMIIDDDKIKI